jgi:eukaryotic-like serine/threonine-protein kinase
MTELRRRLAGRYELAETIGRGGMGSVYRARDLVLDRTVAVKLLPAALAEEDPRHVTRFEREARATASLTHPGVVAVFDAGQDGDTRFIVMECVEGRSLARVLHEEAPLEPARAAGIAACVADALAAAHAAGIVHRDVKPGNVMLTGDGGVKVLDFGIAHAADGHSLTQSASILGTARYMAPEQALGRRADARSDVYALGCLLYAMLTRRPPFEGDTAAAIIHQQVNSEPVPPSALNGRVPAGLESIVMKMLAKSPAARPQDASRLGEELHRAAAGSPPAAAGDATLVMPRREMGARRRRRRAAAAALVAASLLLLGVLAASLGGAPDRGGAGTSTAAHGAAGGAATGATSAPPSSTQATAAPPPQAPQADAIRQERDEHANGRGPARKGSGKVKKRGRGHGHGEGD